MRRLFAIRSVLLLSLCVAVVAVLLVWWGREDPWRSKARRQWKDQAVARIEQLLGDKAWLAAETARLNSAATSRPFEGAWVGDELLVMQNGDWIVCQNICSKQNRRIKDLFIGRASDGKWYYSTFHFCVGKCVLQMERRPEDLAHFVNAYWLVPFDGRSDDCLNSTWTDSEPWGEQKMQPESSANTGGLQ